MPNNDTSDSLLGWLGILNAPNWKNGRPLGRLIGILLTAVVPLLFLFSLVAAFAVMWHTIKSGATNATGGINLGAGALIAAMLGAPFLIWSTILKHQTVRYQKEGHITDRINKAIEQLGGGKAVERIGRSVTVWAGKPKVISYDAETAATLAGRPRTKLAPKELRQRYNEETDEVDEGYRQTVFTWPEERTVIQWQDSTLNLEPEETVGVEGSWQVFKETAKNIEVRIGAILSLERIAQDSTRYDNGRDHVRVMEILCAYVRENTLIPLLDSEFDEKLRITPRTDIQIAIDVIKRRSQEQIEIEVVNRYRLDLRRCDFRGVNFGLGSFRGAIFAQCRFEFASFRSSDFSGARFHGSILNYLDCMNAKFIGADMRSCRIDKPEPKAGGFLTSINMGDLSGVSLISANISAIQYLGNQQNTFGTKDTKLYWELDEERKAGTGIAEKVRRGKGESDAKKTSNPELKLSENPFIHWSPHDGTDMVTGDRLATFRKSLSLTGWPYED